MRPLTFLALSMCLISLTACQTLAGLKEDLGNINAPGWASSSQPNADLLVENGLCPTVQVVEELGTAHKFFDISDPKDYNLIAQTRIAKVESNCNYSGKSTEANIRLSFEGQRGPQAQDNQFTYPFFVAVTAPNGKILAKEVFDTQLQFNGVNSATAYEDVRQIIPIANQNDGPDYKILIGFQLTQDQLQYNRELIAARIAAEKAAAEAAKQAEKEAAQAKEAMANQEAPVPSQSNEVIIEEIPPYEPPELRAPQPQQDGPIIITPQQ